MSEHILNNAFIIVWKLLLNIEHFLDSKILKRHYSKTCDANSETENYCTGRFRFVVMQGDFGKLRDREKI